jgi:tripartite-type tricarboxylate transporter receptor subunit TctC
MRIAILAALALLAFAGNAHAENFPSRQITIVVPFSAGGPSDAMARVLAERMQRSLGQTILIENVTGAGGSLGVGRVVRSPADGYTIGFGHLGTNVANGAIYKLGYDLVTDLEPVVMLPSNPMIIVSKNTIPAKTLQELLAWLKSKPTPPTAGTAGAGSGSHIAGLYFENVTGIKLQYVPYRGTAPALTDLVAGQIDIIVDQTSNSIAQVRAGTIRAYAERHCDKTQRRGSRSVERSGRAEEARRPRPRYAAKGSALAGGARRLAEGRDCKMVADDQVRQHQDAVNSARVCMPSHDCDALAL